MRTFKNLFLIIISIIAIVIVFNHLLSVELIPHNYSKLEVEIKDSSTDSTLSNIQFVHFLITSDRDNIFDLLLGHISHSYNVKNFNHGFTNNIGQFTIDEFSTFFKLFESFNYEVIIINIVPNNSYFSFKDSFELYGLEKIFVNANSNYENFVVIINNYDPRVIKALSYKGTINSISITREEFEKKSIHININKIKWSFSLTIF